jgi:hypothetical protein
VAKKEKAPKAKAAPKIITISDLEEEFAMHARRIRMKLRNAGFSAPAVENANPTEFGPRNKYQWEEGSEELNKVRGILDGTIKPEADEEEEAPAKPKKSAKKEEPKKAAKKSKKVEPEPEPDEDDEDEEDEDDD